MKKEAWWALGQALPFSGLGFLLAVMGWSGGGAQISETLSPLPKWPVQVKEGVEKASVATLVPWGHTPDVLERAVWTQVAHTTHRHRDLSWEDPGLGNSHKLTSALTHQVCHHPTPN